MKNYQEQLIISHQKMVHFIIRKKLSIQQGSLLYDDLVGVGLEGLIRAAMAYNPTMVKFSTFAYKCIKGKLLNYLNRNQQMLSYEETTDWDGLCADESESDYCVVEQLLSNAHLSQTEEMIIRSCYGIECEPERTLDIAARLGMTQQNVTRIRRIALEKMRMVA